MATRRHTRRKSDPDTATRRLVIWFGLIILATSVAFYYMTDLLTGTGQVSSIIVGGGIALVGAGLSPQIAQLMAPSREYEPPPDELPEPDYDEHVRRSRHRDD